MFKVEEVYEKQVRITEERPDGSSFVSFGKSFDSRPLLLNKDYIVSVQAHTFASDRDLQNIQECFPEGTSFCSLTLDGNSFRKSEILVVGSFSSLCGLLEDRKK